MRSRLKQLRAIGRLQPNDQTIGRRPAVGVLGCMAERVKGELFESELVDLVAGPDAYRDLPRLLEGVACAQPRAASACTPWLSFLRSKVQSAVFG
eukprot:SAG11_NODE_1276_length_5324_cov_2.528421_7_plen_95_part_00